MNFKLNQNEALFMLQILSELPTRMGALPLYQNWEAQYKAQVPAPAEATSNEVNIIEE